MTMKLTKIERLLLVNQLLILEKLYPESAKAYKQERTALREGYELHYKDLFHLIDDETLSEDQCRDVLDVLEMYRAITFSARKLPPTSKIHEHYYLDFHGFDGNNESALMAYTRYFINDLDRYNELREAGKKHDDFNSHSEMSGENTGACCRPGRSPPISTN
jgi:uncharacterized protein YfbU (UPF0304 family)